MVLRYPPQGGILSCQMGREDVKSPEQTHWIILYIPSSPGTHWDLQEGLQDVARGNAHHGPG